MDWHVALGLGALGGLIVEAVVFYSRVSAWQTARHRQREQGRKRLPPLRRYVDPLADALAGLTRVMLGAGAGWLFHPQVTGVYAAVAVGAAAPALLQQFGAARAARMTSQGPEPSDTPAAATGPQSPGVRGTERLRGEQPSAQATVESQRQGVTE